VVVVDTAAADAAMANLMKRAEKAREVIARARAGARTRDLEAENARLRAQVTELQETMTRMTNERRADDLHCQVYAFHRQMGFPTNSVPKVPEDSVVRARLAFAAEELFEQLTACFPFNPALEHAVLDEIRYAKIDVDLVALVDGWADSNSFTEGSAIIFGVDMKPIQRDVARSNATKKRENVQPNSKVAKDADFSPPDIRRLLLEQGWQPDSPSTGGVCVVT